MTGLVLMVFESFLGGTDHAVKRCMDVGRGANMQKKSPVGPRADFSGEFHGGGQRKYSHAFWGREVLQRRGDVI